MGDFWDNPLHRSPREPARIERLFDREGYDAAKAEYDGYMAAVPYNANSPEIRWRDSLTFAQNLAVDMCLPGAPEPPDEVKAHRRHLRWG